MADPYPARRRKQQVPGVEQSQYLAEIAAATAKTVELLTEIRDELRKAQDNA